MKGKEKIIFSFRKGKKALLSVVIASIFIVGIGFSSNQLVLADDSFSEVNATSENVQTKNSIEDSLYGVEDKSSEHSKETSICEHTLSANDCNCVSSMDDNNVNSNLVDDSQVELNSSNSIDNPTKVDDEKNDLIVNNDNLDKEEKEYETESEILERSNLIAEKNKSDIVNQSDIQQLSQKSIEENQSSNDSKIKKMLKQQIVNYLIDSTFKNDDSKDVELKKYFIDEGKGYTVDNFIDELVKRLDIEDYDLSEALKIIPKSVLKSLVIDINSKKDNDDKDWSINVDREKFIENFSDNLTKFIAQYYAHTITSSLKEQFGTENKDLADYLFLEPDQLHRTSTYKEISEKLGQANNLCSRAARDMGQSILSQAISFDSNLITELGSAAIVAVQNAFDYIDKLCYDSEVEFQNERRDSYEEKDNYKLLIEKNENDSNLFAIKPTTPWVHGSKDDMVFEIKRNIGDFITILINGVSVPESAYTIKSGSTIITLKSDYLNHLYNGTYNMTSVFNNNGEKQYITSHFDIQRDQDNYQVPDNEKIYIAENLHGLEVGKENDVVIVIDLSNSMAGESLEVAKKATKKLVDKLLTQENTNISIVTFDGTAHEFTSLDSKEKLYSIIDGLSINVEMNELENRFITTGAGATNYFDALLKTNELFKSLNSDSKKSIIFLSDGIPTYGDISSSELKETTGSENIINYFTEKDHDYARYANEAIQLKESFKGAYNIYTVGYFGNLELVDSRHTLKEEKNYAQQVLKRLATVNSYVTDDLSDLDNTFEDIANKFISPISISLHNKIISEDNENIIYRIDAIVSNTNNIEDLTDVITKLDLYNKGCIINSESIQKQKKLGAGESQLVEWLVKINKSDYKNNDKFNFVISSVSNESENVGIDAFFNIKYHPQYIMIQKNDLKNSILSGIPKLSQNKRTLFKSIKVLDKTDYQSEQIKMLDKLNDKIDSSIKRAYSINEDNVELVTQFETPKNVKHGDIPKYEESMNNLPRTGSDENFNSTMIGIIMVVIGLLDIKVNRFKK